MGLRGGNLSGAASVTDPGLLGLLHPAWQAVLGVAVVLLIVVAGARLLTRHGPSRMTRAALTAAVVVMAIIALASWCSG